MGKWIWILFTTGSLLGQQARLDEAFFNGDRRTILREMADRLKAEHRKDALILAECGRAYLAAMDPAKAKESLRLAEEREPHDAAVLRLIAQAWLKNGHKSEAFSAYDRALRNDPKNVEALTHCAVDLAELGFTNEAEKFMRAVAVREPEGWECFVMFGQAFLVAGQRKPAASWFARALAVKPDEDRIWLDIMRVFAETQAVM